MPDASVWVCPAHIVARHRADFYADSARHSFGDQCAAYRREFDDAMSSPATLEDWAKNNMDWEEIAPYASLSTPPPITEYGTQWLDATVQVCEIE